MHGTTLDRKLKSVLKIREKEELKKEAEECAKDMVNEILKTALFIYLGKAAAREATKAKKRNDRQHVVKSSYIRS